MKNSKRILESKILFYRKNSWKIFLEPQNFPNKGPWTEHEKFLEPEILTKSPEIKNAQQKNFLGLKIHRKKIPGVNVYEK